MVLLIIQSLSQICFWSYSSLCHFQNISAFLFHFRPLCQTILDNHQLYLWQSWTTITKTTIQLKTKKRHLCKRVLTSSWCAYFLFLLCLDMANKNVQPQDLTIELVWVWDGVRWSISCQTKLQSRLWLWLCWGRVKETWNWKQI